MAAIEVEHLTKRYGARRGIVDVSLQVPEGTLFGFIGPNGSGKTTTIRILLGLIKPTTGAARLHGIDVVTRGPAARAGIGYVAGETNVYPRMRAGEMLAYLGRFHPGDHAERRRELADLLDLDLAAVAADLSLGNRKKVAIVAAFQHRPRLAILDEPSTGLDPLIQAKLRELLSAELHRGATVFLSSHVLAEVQAVCRTVAVLREGRLLAVEDVATLRARSVRRVRATFDTALPDLAAVAGVHELVAADRVLSFMFDGSVPSLLGALAAARPTDVLIEEPSLDDVFLRYYAKAERDA